MRLRATRTWLAGSALLLLAVLPGACGWSCDDCVRDPVVFAVTTGGDLIAFYPETPWWILDSEPISGLQPGESLVAIDFRPGTDDLYGVGDTGRLYEIDEGDGDATEVGVGPFAVLLGTSFGMEFDPVADVIRLVSDADQNLRVDPDSGALLSTDTALAYDAADPHVGANPAVTAIAHTDNFDTATETTLFGLDTDLDVLVRVGSLDGSPVSPNAGTLFTVGSIGVNAESPAAFDTFRWFGEDHAYAAFTTPGSAESLFFWITLATGSRTLVGTIDSSDPVVAMAVRR
jgi:hypothetical protein